LPEGAGGSCVEGDGVKFVFGLLQHCDPAGAFLVGRVVVSVYQVYARCQFGPGDGADGHFVRQVFSWNPATQRQDIGIQ